MSKKFSWDYGKSYFSQLINLISGNFGKIPSEYRVFVIIALCMVGVILSAMTGCFIAGQIQFAVSLAVLLIVVLAICLILTTNSERQLLTDHGKNKKGIEVKTLQLDSPKIDQNETAPDRLNADTNSPRIKWGRICGPSRLSDSSMNSIHEELKNLRRQANIALNENDYNCSMDNLRAIFFLFDFDGGRLGDVGSLKVPPKCFVCSESGLKKGELKLVFYPHQGLTGRVYCTGEEGFQKRLADGWPLDHHLDSDHLLLLHDQLQWVLAVPVPYLRKSNEDSPVMYGILCLDAVDIDVELQKTQQALLKQTMVIAASTIGSVIQKIEKQFKVSIQIEELKQ